MPVELDQIGSFISALAEVEVLIASACGCVGDERRYATYNKAAILLLAGKFENFVEAIAEQYIFTVNSLRLRSCDVPDELRLNHTFTVLGQIEALKNKVRRSDAVNIFKSLGELWVTSNASDAIKVKCKFDYGKHGEAELVRIFSNLGIADVFTEVTVYRRSDAEDPDSLQVVDFKGVFNSVTYIRNNILHEDATPTLTHVAIAEHKALFQYFAEKLTENLVGRLEALSTGISVGPVTGHLTSVQFPSGSSTEDPDSPPTVLR